MTDNRQERLEILANPIESPEIECKSWLDLGDKRHKATIAKAAIALANSGGGTIVFGVSEDNSRGGILTCKPRPSCLHKYTSDAISSTINTYADPEIDFKLVFENHPETGEEHAFVLIPGGMRQPIFAKKGYFDDIKKKTIIKKQACYIRKPGPKSEEPDNLEWRNLLDRCVQADASISSSVNPTDDQKLLKFMITSKARWQERLSEVDEDDVARLKHGYWAFAFSILEVPAWPSLTDLREDLRRAALGRYSLILFEQNSELGLAPYAADGAIEAWTGSPTPGYSRSSPYRCSFWRATERGEFYHLQGFFEDSELSRVELATRHFVDHSIQLHAKMLMVAARIANSVSEDAEIVVCSEMTGLKGRYLTGSQDWWGHENRWLSSIDPDVLGPRRLTPQQINDNLPEILCDFLYPLYENFNFYQLKPGWVEAAVKEVKGDGW